MVKRRWWLTPVILATQEAEIRRTMVQKHLTQKRAGRVAQVVEYLHSLEFKPQYHIHKNIVFDERAMTTIKAKKLNRI
jgi:hypothetical protein